MIGSATPRRISGSSVSSRAKKILQRQLQPFRCGGYSRCSGQGAYSYLPCDPSPSLTVLSCPRGFLHLEGPATELSGLAITLPFRLRSSILPFHCDFSSPPHWLAAEPSEVDKVGAEARRSTVISPHHPTGWQPNHRKWTK